MHLDLFFQRSNFTSVTGNMVGNEDAEKESDPKPNVGFFFFNRHDWEPP
jgi:hypothetical protein